MGGDDAVDSEPVVRATPHLKGATPSGHTFAHSHQAVPCPVGPLDASHPGSSSVVEDLQGDVVGVMADDDLGSGGRTAVLEDVGEGFLGNAVTGQLGALGEGFVAFRVSFDPEVDGQRSLHLLDQTRNVVKALGGCEFGVGVVVAQHPDETAGRAVVAIVSRAWALAARRVSASPTSSWWAR